MQSLLTPARQLLPFLQRQLDTQKDTITTIQQQTKLSEQLVRMER